MSLCLLWACSDMPGSQLCGWVRKGQSYHHLLLSENSRCLLPPWGQRWVLLISTKTAASFRDTGCSWDGSCMILGPGRKVCLMLVSLEATLRPAEERLGRTQRQPQCQPAEHSGEQGRLLPPPAWMPELQPKPYRAGVKAVFQPHLG